MVGHLSLKWGAAGIVPDGKGEVPSPFSEYGRLLAPSYASVSCRSLQNSEAVADHRQQQGMGAESLFSGEQRPSVNGHHLVSGYKVLNGQSHSRVAPLI